MRIKFWWTFWLALGLVFWIVVAFAFVRVVRGADLGNDFLGLRAAPSNGVLAYCSLSPQKATPRAAVWVGIGGSASLDIVQIGSIADANGRHFFAAYGQGEPNAAGSLYREVNLGPADSLAHKFTVQMANGQWSLSIDGRTKLRVAPLAWTPRGSEVFAETEPGGTVMPASACRSARTLTTRWAMPTWGLFGYGAAAAQATVTEGADWFRIY